MARCTEDTDSGNEEISCEISILRPYRWWFRAQKTGIRGSTGNWNHVIHYAGSHRIIPAHFSNASLAKGWAVRVWADPQPEWQLNCTLLTALCFVSGRWTERVPCTLYVMMFRWIKEEKIGGTCSIHEKSQKITFETKYRTYLQPDKELDLVIAVRRECKYELRDIWYILSTNSTRNVFNNLCMLFVLLL